MDARQIQSALDVLGADARHIAVYTRGKVKSASKHLVQRAMPGDAAACAQELFAVLRAFDDAGVKLIWIETPPPAPEWDGVRDRLQRAAA
jgi:L-threonylcarbamoyladenylate synthase